MTEQINFFQSMSSMSFIKIELKYLWRFISVINGQNVNKLLFGTKVIFCDNK